MQGQESHSPVEPSKRQHGSRELKSLSKDRTDPKAITTSSEGERNSQRDLTEKKRLPDGASYLDSKSCKGVKDELRNSGRRGSDLGESDSEISEGNLKKRMRVLRSQQLSLRRPANQELRFAKGQLGSTNIALMSKFGSRPASLDGPSGIPQTGPLSRTSGFQFTFESKMKMSGWARNSKDSTSQLGSRFLGPVPSLENVSQTQNVNRGQVTPQSLSSKDHDRLARRSSIFFDPVISRGNKSNSNHPKSRSGSKKQPSHNSDSKSKKLKTGNTTDLASLRKKRRKLQRVSRNIKKYWKNNQKMPKHVFRKRVQIGPDSEQNWARNNQTRRHFDLVNPRTTQSSIFIYGAEGLSHEPEIKLVPPNSEVRCGPALSKEQLLWSRVKTSKPEVPLEFRMQTVIGFDGVWERTESSRVNKRPSQVVFIDFSGKDVNRFNSGMGKTGGSVGKG